MASSHRSLLYHALCILAGLLPMTFGPAYAYDWLQFGGNAQHSGNNTAETILNPGNIASLIQRYQVMLPSIADGAPVFLEGVVTAGGVKNLLFVTTLNGWTVALDARNGATVWSHQYGPNGCKINHGSTDCYTTSSPAIDPNRLYVYSYGLDGNVHKYQVGDGTEIMTGGWPQSTTLKGYDEKGSSALSIATSAGATYLYVAHGGYPGDNGDYQGHVTAINLATGVQNVFNAACSDQAVHLRAFGGGVSPTCATRQNAIWSRPGVIYDAGTDRIFMGTGNAFTAAQGRFDGIHNWSESVIALRPDATGGTGVNAGKPLDSYTPINHASLDDADADVGSTAPAILPVPPTSRVQHLGVQSGKDGKLRLLDLQNLSGLGNPGNVGGEIGTIIDVPPLGGGVFSQPAVWVNPADNSTWIFVVNGNGTSALRLNFDGSGNPSLPPMQWHDVQSGTSPIIANNMVFLLSGTSVRALDPISGNQLWSWATTGSPHWQSVIVANGAVYATDQAGHLAAFGLPQNPAWVEDAVPAGAAVVSNGGDSWNWVASNPTPYSGALAHQSAIASGFHQHYFQGASATLAVDVGDILFTYVYLDPANPPSELMLQWNDGSWEHRAYWGPNLIGLGIDGTVSRRFMGPLPPTGQWVRLAVPAAQVGLEGRTLNGMAFSLFGGRATWDYAWKTTAWVQDAAPAGAALWNDGGDSWNWVSSNPTPYSGALAHQSALVAGFHQHYFTGATATLAVSVGDTLFNYVYLDPANPPSELMLQWNDGSWEHRAYWGANVIPFGTDGSASRRYMGPLPPNGQWVRLGVPAADVGLEGRALNGMAFSLFGGRATWDYASTSSAWVQDALPTGAAVWSDGGDAWNWVTSNPTPFSGTYAHQSALAAGYHQHYFALATDTLVVGVGDTLFTYVYLDPANPPSEVMVQWNDGSWEHRAYWGPNLIGLGIDGTASRRNMGSLPATGQWVRLAVPAAQVGLEGRTVNGMAFTLWNGRATWDYSGK
jgi:hypothetical protein